MHPFQTSYALDANHPEAGFFSKGLYGPCADGRVPYVPTRRAYVISVETNPTHSAKAGPLKLQEYMPRSFDRTHL